MGVFFGEEKWAWEDVLTRKQSFMDMLVGATSRSEPVFLKVQVRGKGECVIMSKPGEKLRVKKKRQTNVMQLFNEKMSLKVQKYDHVDAREKFICFFYNSKLCASTV